MIRLTDTPEPKSRWLDASRVNGMSEKCPFEMPTMTGKKTYYGDTIALLKGDTCLQCEHHIERRRIEGSDNFEVHCAHP